MSRALGIQPDCVAGHSFGELVALHAAGSFDEATLLRLSRIRGELMSETGDDGAMLAADMAPDEANRIIQDLSGRVWLANVNSPWQVVFSGSAEAVTLLENRLGNQGVTVRRLRTSTAFHTPMLTSAHRPFLDESDRAEFRPPLIDVYGNTDADCYPAEPELIRRRLADQLLAPIRFANQILPMYDAGVRTFVELGAGAVHQE